MLTEPAKYHPNFRAGPRHGPRWDCREPLKYSDDFHAVKPSSFATGSTQSQAGMLTTNAHKGEPCLIVGGGPSVTGFDFAPFERGLVIGVNMAALRYPSNLCYVEDKRVLGCRKLLPDWPKPRIFHAVEPDLPDLEGWQVVGSTGGEWSESLSDGLVHASNAGVSALNLACVLGCDPIYLIGFDLVPAEDGKTQHFHGDYPAEWRQPGHVYQRFVQDFEKHAPAALAGGRRIINLSPGSALECFEKADQ